MGISLKCPNCTLDQQEEIKVFADFSEYLAPELSILSLSSITSRTSLLDVRHFILGKVFQLQEVVSTIWHLFQNYRSNRKDCSFASSVIFFSLPLLITDFFPYLSFLVIEIM